MYPEPLTQGDTVTNSTNNPAELDAMLRRAHARGRLDTPPDPDDEADQAPPEPEGPKPGPLPGGAAAPIPPAPPSGEQIIRGAIAAARGEHVDWSVRRFVNPGSATSSTFEVPR